MTAQIALLSGVTSFPDPGNWTPASNKIEVVATGSVGGNSVTNATGGNGARGGNYAWDVNQTPIFPVPVNIPATTQVWWRSASQTPGDVIAGSAGVFYPTTQGFMGGAGGLGSSTSSGNLTGAGGGGPAGPAGIGLPAPGTATNGNVSGGFGNNGSAPPGTHISEPGHIENPVTWPLVNAGLGGGGAGGIGTAGTGGIGGGSGGGAGARYGGGGGGGGWTSTSGNIGYWGGQPGGGIIVVTWDPAFAGESVLVGTVSSQSTSRAYMVIEPSQDAELDNPRWLNLVVPGDAGPMVMSKNTRTRPPSTLLTRIFLLPYRATGFQPSSFPNPGNWNPNNNTVECVGYGADGLQGVTSSFHAAGVGGGAGAYAVGANLAPTFPVPFFVSTNIDVPSGTTQEYTYWNGFTATPGNVYASNGNLGFIATQGTSSSGGPGGQIFYPNGFVGGNGGGGQTSDSGISAGGGGGAAGPNGAGGNGGTGSGTTSGNGGTSDGGTIPASLPNSGSVGRTGTQWGNYGTGAGGAGGQYIGGNGGQHGGGGAGGFGYGTDAGGIGGDALIIITYEPPSAPPGPPPGSLNQAMILA